jgi:hypothetical protein
MKKFIKVIQMFFGLVILGLLAWAGYELLLAVVLLFKSVDPKLGAGMLAASATILVSVVSVLFSKKQEHKVDIENQLREKKIPIYENIIEFIFLITFAEKLGKAQPSEKETIAFFADTTRDLVIWGSKDIVKAFGDFKDMLASFAENGDTAGMLATLEDFLFAIRKDLGHKQTKVKRGDILRLYINDVDALFPQLNKASQQDAA